MEGDFGGKGQEVFGENCGRGLRLLLKGSWKPGPGCCRCRRRWVALCGERRHPPRHVMARRGTSAGPWGLVPHRPSEELPWLGISRDPLDPPGAAAKRSIPRALPVWVAVALRMFSLFPLPGEERMAS